MIEYYVISLEGFIRYINTLPEDGVAYVSTEAWECS